MDRSPPHLQLPERWAFGVTLHSLLGCVMQDGHQQARALEWSLERLLAWSELRRPRRTPHFLAFHMAGRLQDDGRRDGGGTSGRGESGQDGVATSMKVEEAVSFPSTSRSSSPSPTAATPPTLAHDTAGSGGERVRLSHPTQLNHDPAGLGLTLDGHASCLALTHLSTILLHPYIRYSFPPRLTSFQPSSCLVLAIHLVAFHILRLAWNTKNQRHCSAATR